MVISIHSGLLGVNINATIGICEEWTTPQCGVPYVSVLQGTGRAIALG